MTERFLYRRGARHEVTQLDGVRAVLTDQDSRSDRSGDPASDTASPSVAVQPEELEAFTASGWAFVSVNESTRSTEGQLLDGEAPVYQTKKGRTLIGTDSMTIQFERELDQSAAEEMLTNRGLEVVRELRFAPNQYEVRVTDGEPLEIANELQEHDDVVYAEVSFVEHIGQRLTPTDPAFSRQWHLENDGAGTGAVSGADISAVDAWDFTRGSGVVIAVIDNGFDIDHPDLEDGVTAQSGFFDAQGVFNQTLMSYPDNDHGTFCAGMAGARHNNGVDGCGSAPEARLTLVASRADQTGTQATLARAVAYSADPSTEVDDADPGRGADVIVSSLGPNGADWALTSVLENALVFAQQRGRRGRGCPVLWASSNGDNVDIALDEVVSHPAVMAVGRSTNADAEDNSARGAELDFLAPGVSVRSTASGGGTRVSTGTSFAAPLAAGVAALVLSINPRLRALQVRDLLRSTSDKIGNVTYDSAGRHPDYGFGRINAYAAVVEALHSRSVFAGNTDEDGDVQSEIHIVSPWGLGTLDVQGTALTAAALEPNGSRFNGWLLDTASNNFELHGDFTNSGSNQILVNSPWGIGLLRLQQGTYEAEFLTPNGTRLGDWILSTENDRFGPAGRFSGQGPEEIFVRSPWGIGVMEVANKELRPLLMNPNGTRFGGWLLDTATNRFGPVGDLDGDGADELVVRSDWGLGVLKVSGGGIDSLMLKPNGTVFGSWRLNTNNDWIGPVADFDGDGREEVLMMSRWGIGLLSLESDTFTSAAMTKNGTSVGGWRLNTLNDRLIGVGDFTGDGRPELVVTSRWGIGVLAYDAGTQTFDAVTLKPNGTRFGDWLLNTTDNKFHVARDMHGDGRANLVVESPWGLAVLTLKGGSFSPVTIASNGTSLGGWRLNTARDLLRVG